MEAPLCHLCELPSDSIYLECGNPSCLAKTCDICIGSYIRIAARESILPSCTTDNCHGVLMFSAISQLDSKIVDDFLTACHAFIMRDKMDAVQAELAQKKAIEELRRKRISFINTEFPAAIALVADLACQSKIKRVKKSMAQKGPATRNMTRICMNLFCSGLLDEEFICTSCSTQFCKECEERIEPNHQCLEENIESVKLTRSMVKCPNCFLPIERSSGCPSMTCMNCKTNFDYRTGERGGHGNGNNKGVHAVEKLRLSTVYKSTFTTDQLQIILLIEAKEPKLQSDVKIRNLVKAILQHRINESTAKLRLAKILEEYYTSKYVYRQYQRIIIGIENLLRKNAVTTKKLIEISQQI